MRRAGRGADLVLAGLSLGLFLAASEWAFGALYPPPETRPDAFLEYDPETIWRLKPGHRSARRDPVGPGRAAAAWRITTNSRGHRGAEMPREKPPGAVRILVLGDSVSFGSKVNDDETFPAVLEELLEGDAPGPRTRVINAGVPGYSAFQEYVALRRALALEPDVVVLQFTLNDVTEPFQLLPRYGGTGLERALLHAGGERAISDLPAAAHWLTRHSALYRFLRDALARARFRTTSREGVAARAKELEVFRVESLVRRAGDPRILAAWDEYLGWLDRILDVCDARDLRCLVVATPWRFQLALRDRANRPHRFLEEVVRARGVEFVDLLPAIQERIRSDALAELPLDPDLPLPRLAAARQVSPAQLDAYWYRYFTDYDHFSPAGHRLVAGVLADLLRR